MKTAAIALSLMIPLSVQAVSVSEKTYKISKFLKGIPQNEWQEITGDQFTEEYEVVAGDTLYGVAARLFGDGKYWPKVWALNNNRILNPHAIEPGLKIAFQSGSGSMLPSLSLQPKSPLLASNDPPKRKRRSEEWKHLPKQGWEATMIEITDPTDAAEFVTAEAIEIKKRRSIDLSAVIASEKLPQFGEIMATRKESTFATLADSVYIKPRDGIQVGATYTITDPNPNGLEGGHHYTLLGAVKVDKNEGDLYIGRVIRASGPIPRGTVLVEEIKPVDLKTPIAGPDGIKAKLLVDPTRNSIVAAQHALTFVAKGQADGIEPGMIFRAYQHKDPFNSDTITDANLIPDADFEVVHATENYSTLMTIRSFRQVEKDTPLILLTDVSDLLIKSRVAPIVLESNELQEEEIEEEIEAPIEEPLKMEEPVVPEEPVQEAKDPLDELDTGDGLTDAEKQELDQLENWEGEPTPTEGKVEEPAPSTDETSKPAAGTETENELDPESEDAELEGTELEDADFDDLEEVDFDDLPEADELDTEDQIEQ